MASEKIFGDGDTSNETQPIFSEDPADEDGGFNFEFNFDGRCPLH
jgi:hypothetical protein